MERQTVSVEMTESSGWSAWAYCDGDKRYAECPTQYGKTEGEAAGLVLAWLVDHGADVSRLEVVVH